MVSKIPYGKVATYKQVADLAGNKNSARVVGNILNKNKNFSLVKCFRVVRSDGSVGGYIGGNLNKEKMLKKEGIRVKNRKVVDFNKKIWKIDKKRLLKGKIQTLFL